MIKKVYILWKNETNVSLKQYKELTKKDKFIYPEEHDNYPEYKQIWDEEEKEDAFKQLSYCRCDHNEHEKVVYITEYFLEECFIDKEIDDLVENCIVDSVGLYFAELDKHIN